MTLVFFQLAFETLEQGEGVSGGTETMVVKGESPRSGAKMPDGNSYGGGGGFFNRGRD